MTYKTEINLKIPNLKDLYCINCKINPLYMKKTIIKSLFHHQILTCRLIIYSVRCCIASPSIENVENCIHVIINKQFYYTGKLQKHLLNLQVQFTNPEPVHLKIYEACLKYMFTFKLAPLWNLIGNSFYLHGFSFLSLPCSVDTVEWNILFKDGDTKLEMKPMKMTLFPLTHEYVTKNTNLLISTMANSNCTINSNNLTSFHNSWVYVLPKLTKARIVSISKTIPSNCPFANYDDFRRYWKNMYSYRLPKVDEKEMLFYEVIFPMNPHKKFIYPEICILSKIPEFLMCDNKSKIICEFIKDLSTNVYSVCGEVIKIGHLFPELNVEYSCILKRKSVNLEKDNVIELKNNFCKTSDCTIKSTNEKMSLSSFFALGFDQKCASTKKNSQQILFIMKSNVNSGQKRKEISITEINDEYFTEIINDKKQKIYKKNYSKKYTKNPSLISGKETIIDNINNIFAYYGLPLMHTNNNNLGFINENYTIVTDKNEILLDYKDSFLKDYLKYSYLNKKPIIKNIESVCMNLIDYKKFKMIQVLNVYEKFDQDLHTVQLDKNFLYSTNISTPLLTLDISDNFNNIKQLSDKVQSTMSTINSTLQNEKLLQISEHSNELKLESKKYNQLRLLLFKFDFYNKYQQNDHFQVIIYNDIISTSSIQTKKLSKNLDTNKFNSNIYKSIKMSHTNQKFKIQHFNKSIFNINDYLYNLLQCSSSLLDISKKKHIKYLFSKLYKSLQYNKINENKGNLRELIPSKFITTQKIRTKLLRIAEYNTTNVKKKYIYTSSSLQFIVNSNIKFEFKKQEPMKDLYYQNRKLNYNNLKSLLFKIKLKFKLKKEIFQTLQCSCIIQNLSKKKFEINENILFKFPVSKLNSKNKVENKQLIICKFIKTIYDKNKKNKIEYSVFAYEKQNKKIEDSSQKKQNFLKHDLNNITTYKTPSSIYFFNSNNKLENICSLESLSQYSSSTYNTSSNIQNKKVSHRNTDTDSCNFNNTKLLNSNKLQLNLTLRLKNNGCNSISILSQSSNEFNSDNYESYKLACKEALTFD